MTEDAYGRELLARAQCEIGLTAQVIQENSKLFETEKLMVFLIQKKCRENQHLAINGLEYRQQAPYHSVKATRVFPNANIWVAAVKVKMNRIFGWRWQILEGDDVVDQELELRITQASILPRLHITSWKDLEMERKVYLMNLPLKSACKFTRARKVYLWNRSLKSTCRYTGPERFI